MRKRRIFGDFSPIASKWISHLHELLVKSSRFRVSIWWFERLSNLLDKHSTARRNQTDGDIASFTYKSA